MGVLNVTPDSFSDGGLYLCAEDAHRRTLEIIEEGAKIVDIGGESSRPGAEQISESEELRRVIPVVERLRSSSDIIISVDTTKSSVARAALNSGADMINDISAGLMDDDMLPLVAKRSAGYVLMHMQGTPPDMQRRPEYADVVTEVYDFLAMRIQVCRRSGISRERLVIDPGIGFGKSLEHNLALLNKFERFVGLDCPMMIGASRKSFVGKLSGTSDRLGGSLASALEAVRRGANIVRAHDVAQTVQAVRVQRAIRLSN
ncbi:MAG: dihydropteroate synthase [candidate division Zixibacteria bacterium]|nr:dihydropteroate synthase [candidate division Zixibacteria bacterium]